MKIFVVEHFEQYDSGDGVLGAFSTYEKAKKFLVLRKRITANQKPNSRSNKYAVWRNDYNTEGVCISTIVVDKMY